MTKNIPKGKIKSWLLKLSSTDAWRNPVTGMGIVGRDKAQSIDFGENPRLTRAELDALGRDDGLSRKIIGRIVDDALRSGWTVTFKGNKDNPVTTRDAIEFNERLVDWYKSVRLKTNIGMHVKQARQYGGSLLALGAMDGQDPSQPLNPEGVTEFSWMRAHDRYQVSSQTYEVEIDPSSKDFGFPSSYTMYSVQSTTSTAFAQFNQNQGSGKGNDLLNVPVHASRVWRTDGVVISERVRLRSEGWGDSVLQAAFEPLRGFSSAMRSSLTIVQEFVQGIYKVQDLKGIILANGDETVRKRFALMDFIRSQWNAVLVDADNEEYTRTTTSIAGLPELIDRFMIHLSAVTEMPMTLLFGVSPGGFGTGESEGNNWDDTVKSFQTDTIEPMLEYILGILFQTPDFKDFPKDWSIKFTSLQLLDPVQEAEVRLKTAQADALDIQSAVLGADEVATSRYGGAAYSTDTHLDEVGREMDRLAEEEALAGGGVAGEVEALNGIQITSMLEVLERVKTGVLPKASAKVALSVSFPQMSAEAISGMVDPIEVTGPLDDGGSSFRGRPTRSAPPQTRVSTSANADGPPDEGADDTESNNEEEPEEDGQGGAE